MENRLKSIKRFKSFEVHRVDQSCNNDICDIALSDEVSVDGNDMQVSISFTYKIFISDLDVADLEKLRADTRLHKAKASAKICSVFIWFKSSP